MRATTTNVLNLGYYQKCSMQDEPYWTLTDAKEIDAYARIWGSEHFCPVHGIHVYMQMGKYCATAQSNRDEIRKHADTANMVTKDGFTIRDRDDNYWEIDCPKQYVIAVIKLLSSSKPLLKYTLYHSNLTDKHVKHLIELAKIFDTKQRALNKIGTRYISVFEKVSFALDANGRPLIVSEDGMPGSLSYVYNPNLTAAQRIARRKMIDNEYEFELKKINKAQRNALNALRRDEVKNNNTTGAANE